MSLCDVFLPNCSHWSKQEQAGVENEWETVSAYVNRLKCTDVMWTRFEQITIKDWVT